MMKMICRAMSLLFALVASGTVSAGLPYVPIEFPRDDFAHYENVPYAVTKMTEWWYFNGQLTTKDGRHFGYYVAYSYFLPGWNTGKAAPYPLLLLQLTDVDNKKVYGTAVPMKPKKGYFSTTDMDVKIGTNTLTKIADTFYVDAGIQTKQGDNVHVNFELTPTRTPMLVGGNGYVTEDLGTTSYYYSKTDVNTQGSFEINGEKYSIDPKQSLSWYDRQWGDFSVHINGMWFWTSIQLKNGMAINLRWGVDPKTKLPLPDFCDATILMPDNSQIFTKNITVENYLPQGDDYPTDYYITIPQLGLHLTLHDAVGHQNAGGIYEGIVSAEGYDSHNSHVEGTAWAESSIRNK